MAFGTMISTLPPDMPRPSKRKDLVTRRAREMGGLGGRAPQPPEATVVNICSLWAYRFCVSWLRPPEATGVGGFPDPVGIE